MLIRYRDLTAGVKKGASGAARSERESRGGQGRGRLAPPLGSYVWVRSTTPVHGTVEHGRKRRRGADPTLSLPPSANDAKER